MAGTAKWKGIVKGMSSRVGTWRRVSVAVAFSGLNHCAGCYDHDLFLLEPAMVCYNHGCQGERAVMKREEGGVQLLAAAMARIGYAAMTTGSEGVLREVILLQIHN